MNKLSDHELIAGIKQNDHIAFETLFNRYWEYLYRIIYNRIKDQEQAKDIVQDIFTYIWKNRNSLSIRKEIKPYLYTAAKYQFFQLYKKNKLKQVYQYDLDFSEIDPSQTDDLLLSKEIESLIEKELSKMPIQIRRCYTLNKINGRTVKEIAVELQLSEKTVRTYISYALHALKHQLGKNAAETLSIILLSEILLHKI